tara:strand:+ start:250 stop:549 length:300 start_codon:yes stop_codon:yes gene_type:complete
MNKIFFKAKPLIFLIHIFVFLLLLGAKNHLSFSPDMAGERLRAELKFLEEENVIIHNPPPIAKAQNIALIEQEIQDESSTPHKKKKKGGSREQIWLRAR